MKQQGAMQKRVHAKKSLGQNFLTDKNKAEKIAQSLEAHEGDTILEIGPGCGDLTQFLLATGAHVHAIELDERAIEIMQENFGSHPKFSIEHGDVLKFNLHEYASNYMQMIDGAAIPRLKVAGNIPYYITSDILFLLFNHADMIQKAVIMMQKEVAERICAERSTKEYGILSVAARFVSKPKNILKVPAGCFTPKPNVDSAVVLFDFSQKKINAEQFKRVHPLVRMAFGQRRKVLSNALKPYLSNYHEEIPESIAMLLKKRAEELLPEDFLVLADLLIPNKK